MNNAHLTAISRTKPSATCTYLYENSLLNGKVLDFGCDKGKDVEFLSAKQVDVSGFDPFYSPYYNLLDQKYDVVMCNFVLNVIENSEERNDVVNQIRELLNKDGVAYIAVRNDKSNLKGYTKRRTWQGYIELPYPVVKRTSSYVLYEVRK